ncbi:hypothetical protein ACFL3Q_05615 [Planctomycetota bacterium]
MNWDRGLKRVRLVLSVIGALGGIIFPLATGAADEGIWVLFIIVVVVVVFFGVVWVGMTVIMWVRKGFCEDKQKDLKKTNESGPKQKGGDYDN